MKHYVYADNAATTQLDPEAFEAMKPYLLNDFGNASQPYSFARSSRRALQDARETIASCIGAKPDEIYFTSGGTESDNWAIKGSAFSDSNHNAIITSAIEHHAVLNSCEALKRLSYPVKYLRPDSDGIISAETLSRMITDKTRLVSVMYANNETGSIQPVKELAATAKSHGALFHTDAVQAVGHVEIDVKELGVDMLSASAHKFNGPKGTGFLYIREGVKISPLMDGGAQEKNMRAGTENIAGIVGMSAALKNNCEHLHSNMKKILSLENLLISNLSSLGIPFIRNGGKHTLPGLLSLSFKGEDGEAILHRMDLSGISISTGSACDSKRTQISHVLKAIRLDESYAKGTIRISLGKNNTAIDIEAITSALAKILLHA